MSDKASLTLKRRLNAAPQRVYRAWTDPENLSQWWGPDGGPVLSAELDARVGGTFRIRFKTLDSDEEHCVGGTYQEVAPDERLVFSWAWQSTPERESLVTVTLKPDGDGTILTLVHERFFDEAARDGHMRGWTGTLARLEAYVAA